MPKMFSAPALSSDLIRLCAPVTAPAASWGAIAGPFTAFCSVICPLSCPAVALDLTSVSPTKNPSSRSADEGSTRVLRLKPLAHASRAYENLAVVPKELHAHSMPLARDGAQLSLPVVPDSGIRI